MYDLQLASTITTKLAKPDTPQVIHSFKCKDNDNFFFFLVGMLFLKTL